MPRIYTPGLDGLPRSFATSTEPFRLSSEVRITQSFLASREASRIVRVDRLI
jgi:hypothetical protein